MQRFPSSSIISLLLKITISASMISALLSLFIWLRAGTPLELINIDELIAPAVVESMSSRGDLNSNWRLATELPEYFQYDQHNFYSYHLIAIPFASTGDPLHDIVNLRILNVAMQIISLVLLGLALWLSKVSYFKIYLTLAAITLSPIMIFDAHIARAESLLYLLFAGLCVVAAARLRMTSKYAIAGIIIGFGVASKITFLAASLIFLPELVRALMVQPRSAFTPFLVALLGVMLGFFLGAPYAVLEPDVFLNGVRYLMTQYSTGHPPHSWQGSGIFDHAAHLILFMSILTGIAWITLYVKPIERHLWLIGVALFSFFTFSYFATKPVFFERNIGLAVLGATLVGFSQTRCRVTSGALGLSLVLMAWWSWNIADAIKNKGERIATYEQAIFGKIVSRVWPYGAQDGLLKGCEGVFGLVDYLDPESKRLAETIDTPPISTFEGRFSIMPTTTLHTYLETNVAYYNCDD